MSERVSYNQEFLDFIKGLTPISPEVIFWNKPEGIVSIHADESKTIGFKIVAPKESLVFEGECLAFARYSEFLSVMKMIESPTVTKNDNKLIISNGSGKITYILSDPRALNKTPARLEPGVPDVVVSMNKQNFVELFKLGAALKAKYNTISFSNGELKFDLNTNAVSSSYSKVIFPESVVDKTPDFSFPVNMEFFLKAPQIDEYKIYLCKEGKISILSKVGNVDFLMITNKVVKLDGGQK